MKSDVTIVFEVLNGKGLCDVEFGSVLLSVQSSDGGKDVEEECDVGD